MASELIAIKKTGAGQALPALIVQAGEAAAFVWDKFFTAGIRNPRTRRAYTHAVKRFLAWAESTGVELALSPAMLSGYLDSLPGTILTNTQHLAASRGDFDALVVRHVVILNPGFSVRTERYAVRPCRIQPAAVSQRKPALDFPGTKHPTSRSTRNG